MPRVSVIMPAYNSERFVGGAIESVLAQTYRDCEIVVVDDGSTDATLDAVRSYAATNDRVIVISRPNTGIVGALNDALAASKSEFIARLDSDDLYPANRLGPQVEWLLQHSEFGAVCGGFYTVDPKGRLIREMDCGQTEEEITDELRSGVTRTSLCTYLIRRSVLKSIEGFRPFFVTAEDIDLQLRLGQACRVWYQPGPCYAYRLHDDSVTHTQQSAARAFYESTARRFAAQRLATGTDDCEAGNPVSLPAETSRPTAAREHIQGQLEGLAWKYHGDGQLGKALATGLRACMVRPGKLSAWKGLVALVVKRPRKASDRKEDSRCA